MFSIFRLFGICLICIPVALVGQEAQILKRIPLPPALKEISGMTILPNGDMWLLNDSHNPPDLFKFDPVEKKILAVRHLPVQNFDWEDITSDHQGNLYIGDFGNNYNCRQNLRILVYNPATGYLDSIQFHYPDQKAFPPARQEDWNYNCEALVFFRDSLHLFSKNAFSGNFFTKHYVLPARPGNFTAELRDSLQLKNRVVTGAALSKDGLTLALTGYIIKTKLGFLPFTRASALFFTGFNEGYFLSGKIQRRRLPKFIFARQFESITPWNKTQWLVANENRKPQRHSIWRIKGVRH